MDTINQLPLDPERDEDDEAVSWVELAEIMAEPPGGDNHGRTFAPLPDADFATDDDGNVVRVARRAWFYRGSDTPGSPDEDVKRPAGHDARWGVGRSGRGLSMKEAINRDYLCHGGAHVEFAGPTGGPNGRPPVPVTEAVLESLWTRITLARELISPALRQGPKTPVIREARSQLARDVAGVMDDAAGAGIEAPLMLLLGCSRSTLHRLAREGRTGAA